MGTRGRAFQSRLARARARRRAPARHQRDSRNPYLRHAALAGPQVPGGACRTSDGGADRVRAPPGRRLLTSGLPLPRRSARPARRRPLCRSPGDHRLSGRQRAGDGAVPQPRRLRDLRRPAARALRRRRDAQRPLGPGLLVPPAQPLGRPVGAGRQHRAVLRPRVAALPVGADDRVHLRAGGARAGDRAPRSVRHDVHGAHAPRLRSRRPEPRARHRRGQPLLPDAGLADDADAPARGRAGPPAVEPGVGCVDDLPPGRPDARRARRAVPRHRDERHLDRRAALELPRL